MVGGLPSSDGFASPPMRIRACIDGSYAQDGGVIMTILEVVAVISLCFTVFMIGFSVGKHAKK